MMRYFSRCFYFAAFCQSQARILSNNVMGVIRNKRGFDCFRRKKKDVLARFSSFKGLMTAKIHKHLPGVVHLWCWDNKLERMSRKQAWKSKAFSEEKQSCWWLHPNKQLFTTIHWIDDNSYRSHPHKKFSLNLLTIKAFISRTAHESQSYSLKSMRIVSSINRLENALLLTFTFMAVNPIKISCRWKGGRICDCVYEGREEPICSVELKFSAFVDGTLCEGERGFIKRFWSPRTGSRLIFIQRLESR